MHMMFFLTAFFGALIGLMALVAMFGLLLSPIWLHDYLQEHDIGPRWLQSEAMAFVVWIVNMAIVLALCATFLHYAIASSGQA
jgi:hypothetical protein